MNVVCRVAVDRDEQEELGEQHEHRRLHEHAVQQRAVEVVPQAADEAADDRDEQQQQQHEERLPAGAQVALRVDGGADRRQADGGPRCV